MPAPAPGKLSGWLDVGIDGSITIPAHLLAAAGLTPGEQLHVRMDDDGIVLLSELAALKRAQKIAAPFKRPGVSMVDEFIADKRAEAQREMDGL